MNPKILVLVLSAVLSAAASAAAAPMKTYRGKVTAHPSGKLEIAVNDGSTGNWTLDPKAGVTRGKAKFAANEIHAGDEVVVNVSEDGVIHHVNVLTVKPEKKAPAKAGYWATQKGKGKWWTGEVVKVEPNGTFEIRKPGGPETTHFSNDAKTLTYVEAGGKKRKGSFGDVHPGRTVDAYAMDGRTTQIVVHE